MFRSLITKKVVVALAVGGFLAIAQLSGPAAVTSAPAPEQVDSHYPPGVVTASEMWLDHASMHANERNRAHVRVTSDLAPSAFVVDGPRHSTAPAATGNVTFQVAGHRETVALVNGRADWAIPRDLRPGTHTVIARYNGNRVYQPSRDAALLTVTRADGTLPGQAAGGPAARTAPAQEGGLPSVGSPEGLALYGATGLGLFAIGGVTLLAQRRRRVKA